MGSADEGRWQVLIGARQAASLSFLMVVIMTLFSSASYLAGRVVTASEQAKTKRQAPQNVVVVDGPKKCPESPPPPAAPVAATPLKPPAQPIAGRTYLQVGAVDRGIAEVFAEYLSRRNLPTAVGQVENGKAYRVLVGPLDSPADIANARSRLEEAGFQSFPRKYPESTAKREPGAGSTPGGDAY